MRSKTVWQNGKRVAEFRNDELVWADPSYLGDNGGGVLVHGDLPDFVSPIDGSVVSGRAGLREHCRKHNVVPTAELKGLPTLVPQRTPDRRQVREAVIQSMTKVLNGR